MNKRKERLRSFSHSGETKRRQYQWTKDEKGNENLVETTPIDIQAEIESYADECDIKTIVRKASFDPQFLASLAQGATDGVEMDISSWPTNIHEYHRMMATAEVKAAQLKAELEKPAEKPAEKGEVKNESE